jgi:hypothetical protein
MVQKGLSDYFLADIVEIIEKHGNWSTSDWLNKRFELYNFEKSDEFRHSDICSFECTVAKYVAYMILHEINEEGMRRLKELLNTTIIKTHPHSQTWLNTLNELIKYVNEHKTKID